MANWIKLFQNRIEFGAFTGTVMNIYFQYNGEFPTWVRNYILIIPFTSQFFYYFFCPLG